MIQNLFGVCSQKKNGGTKTLAVRTDLNKHSLGGKISIKSDLRHQAQDSAVG